jgi:adenylate cyclase
LSKANVEDNTRAETSFQQAIDLDPTFARGYKGLALAINNSAALYGKRNLTEGITAAEVLARQAVELDGMDAEARTRLAATLWMQADYAGALAEVDRALAISPNLAYAHGIRGSTLITCGQPKKGLAALEICLRLDPRDPNLANRLNHVAAGFYYCREYEAAVEAAKRAIRSYPKHPMAYRWLAAALGQTGRTKEAKTALKEAIAIAPASFEMYVRSRVPWMRAENHAHMLEGLRKAGWEGAEPPD